MAEVAGDYFDWCLYGISGWEVSGDNVPWEEASILGFRFGNTGVGGARYTRCVDKA